MGVLMSPSSVLIATMGDCRPTDENPADGSPADRRPAEGRPADGRPVASRQLAWIAECGVRTDAADLRASAGNEAVVGVVSARVGLREGILAEIWSCLPRGRENHDSGREQKSTKTGS